jgi:16S rRNA G527 N7-methylase RsmG
MEKIISVLKKYGVDNKSSHFVDIGSGFGKPTFHVAIMTRANCYGLELVPARVNYCI